MVCEIISTVERRRRWPDGEKLRIIEEALTSGSSIAAVADRNGVCRSLLYTWLRLARSGRIPGITMAAPTPGSFIPVRIAEPGSEPAEAEIAPDPALQRRERIARCAAEAVDPLLHIADGEHSRTKPLADRHE